MTEKVSEMVRRAVNVNGELHLDREGTESLIRVIDAFEIYEMRSQEAIRSMAEAVKSGAMLAEHVARQRVE